MGDLYGIYPPVIQHDWEIPFSQWRFPHENQLWEIVHCQVSRRIFVGHSPDHHRWLGTCFCVFVPLQTKIYDVLKKNMISTMCRYCYKGNNRNPPCVGDVTRQTIGFFTSMFVFLKGIHNIGQHVKIIHVRLYRWLKWMSHFSGKCLAWKNHPKTSRVEGCWANYELP